MPQLPLALPPEALRRVCDPSTFDFESTATLPHLQDVLGQRPTEIEAINGKIVEQGQALGIPTPVNALLTALMRAIEKNYSVEDAQIAEKELQRQLRNAR